MIDIIEKLGIKPIESYFGGRGVHVCNEKSVRELEQQRNEMLNNEIENLISLEYIYKNTNDLGMYGMVVRSRIDNTKQIIEKATGKLWNEIKELK